MTKQIEVLGKAMKVDGALVSLTDLWKGQGAEQRNHPNKWLSNISTIDLINGLMRTTKLQESELLDVRRGRTGGTYAHWQLALAYSKHLSVELHLAVNDVYRRFKQADVELVEHMVERMEDPEDLKRVEMRAKAKASNKALGAAIQSHGGEGRTYAAVNNMNNVAITGKTAKQIKADAGVPERAQTRDLLTATQLAGLNYAEMLETDAIVSKRAIGHDRIVSTCSEIASDVAQITLKHTGGAL